MRDFAKQLITTAAVAAGLAEAAVMDKPNKENITLPDKRLQIEYLSEALVRKPKHIARSDGPADAECPCRIIREQVYETELSVAAEVKSDDENWLAEFVPAFLLALPGKTSNDNGDLVRIEAFKAVRGGFGTRTVEVFTRRSNVLHLRFTGMICRDRTVALIADVNVKDNITYKEEL